MGTPEPPTSVLEKRSNTMKTTINRKHWEIVVLENLFGLLEKDFVIETTTEDIDMVEAFIDEAMSDLTPNQKTVIESRLMTQPADSYRSIGELMSVGKRQGNNAAEYARRIEMKALRLLRHPKRSHKLHSVYQQLKEDETYNILELNVELKKEELAKAENLLRYVRNPQELSAGTPVEELGFSTRTYNCIKRMGITTIGELVSHINCGKPIRNLGTKGGDEITTKLKSFNLI